MRKIKQHDSTSVVEDSKAQEEIEIGSGCFFGTVKLPNNSQHDDQSMFAGFNNSEIMMGEDRVDSAIDDINPNIIIEEHHNNDNLLLDGTILEEIKKTSPSTPTNFEQGLKPPIPKTKTTSKMTNKKKTMGDSQVSIIRKAPI